jgi:transcriptional regulator with XRE-family HTH domain
MTPMQTIGDRIKMLREARGWTQEQLGQILGVTRASVSQWERGETKNIKNKTFLALVSELATTHEYLLFGRDGSSDDSRDISGRWRKSKRRNSR